ncbi:MAG: ABC transporter ATP-binding protein [Planctomycetota bacterium]
MESKQRGAGPGAPAEPALEARGVTRRFRLGLGLRANDALRGIDLEVPRGATLGLVGPNGSGKSTLVRLLAGVDRPTSGTLRVLDAEPRSRAARQRSAYLPEDSPFPGELSATAALDLLGALSGLARKDARARGAALLERVGLGAAQRAPLRAYSRGMLRRFGLAQAFLAAPEVVLLDEPTAGLDALGFAVLDDLLGAASARGATVVLASHILSDVHAHCDHLAVLVAGRVAATGPPATLLATDGRVRLDIDGLDEAGLAALDAWLAPRGARVTARLPGGKGLTELYRGAASAPAAQAPR